MAKKHLALRSKGSLITVKPNKKMLIVSPFIVDIEVEGATQAHEVIGLAEMKKYTRLMNDKVKGLEAKLWKLHDEEQKGKRSDAFDEAKKLVSDVEEEFQEYVDDLRIDIRKAIDRATKGSSRTVGTTQFKGMKIPRDAFAGAAVDGKFAKACKVGAKDFGGAAKEIVTLAKTEAKERASVLRVVQDVKASLKLGGFDSYREETERLGEDVARQEKDLAKLRKKLDSSTRAASDQKKKLEAATKEVVTWSAESKAAAKGADEKLAAESLAKFKEAAANKKKLESASKAAMDAEETARDGVQEAEAQLKKANAAVVKAEGAGPVKLKSELREVFRSLSDPVASYLESLESMGQSLEGAKKPLGQIGKVLKPKLAAKELTRKDKVVLAYDKVSDARDELDANVERRLKEVGKLSADIKKKSSSPSLKGLEETVKALGVFKGFSDFGTGDLAKESTVLMKVKLD